MRRLSASERRLVRWIETHVPGELARAARPAVVQPGEYRGGFVGARRFVMRYGAELVLAALGDMTFVEVDEHGARRWWLERVVSPASYLHFTVKEFAKASGV